MAVRLKGTAFLPNVNWIRDTYGPDVWQRILARLSDEDRRQVEFVQVGAMYPVTLVGALSEALAAEVYPGDRKGAGDAFRRLGAAIAEDNLSGIYSLFVRFQSPEKLLARVPQVVGTMFEGAEADFAADADGKGATVHVRGLGGLAYASPRLCGWAEGAMAKVNAKAVKVTERTWDAGRIASDDLVIEVRWA